MVHSAAIRDAADHRERVYMIADSLGIENATTKSVMDVYDRAKVKVSRPTVSKYLNAYRRELANTSESVADEPEVSEPIETLTEPVKPVEATLGRPSGHVVALFSLIAGVLLSMAANIMHTMVVIPDQTGGSSDAFAVAFASVWPILLFLALEVLTKIQWRADRARWVRIAAVTLIAAVAGWVSFHHMSSLFMYWGDDPIVAYAGPLAIDGLVAVSAMAVANNRRNRQ